MKNIESIIFDLGGVLLDIDFQKTITAFQKAGIPDAGKWMEQKQLPDFFRQFELGQINRKDFFEAINKIAQKSIDEDAITQCWNAMLLNFPQRRLQLLQQLHTYYDLYLMTNTNEIHEACYNEKIRNQTGFPGLYYFFDRAYVSHHLGIRKPDFEIYKRALLENQLNPEHTLFIDDNPDNIHAASQSGMQTIWLQKGMCIETDIFKPKDTSQ